MRMVLFLLFLIMCASGFAQSDWFPVGAKWHYQVMPFQNFPPAPVRPAIMEVINDTVINGKACSEISTFQDAAFSCGNYSSLIYMYEENKKVFSYNPYSDTFHLLYDFNAQVNDSWTIKLPCDPIFDPWSDGDSIIVTVDSISTLIVGGEILKVLHIDLLGAVAERIGMLYAPFPPILICTGVVEEGCASELRCYEDSIIGLFHHTPDIVCDSVYFLGQQEKGYQPQIKIYPNPAQDILTIEIEDISSQTTITIEDINGKIYQRTVLHQLQTAIDIADLLPGIYIIAAKAGDAVLRKKLIKI